MLAEAGVPPDVIRRLLGHTTTRLVEQVYARPRASVIGEQAEEKLVGVAPVLPASSLRRCDKFATAETSGEAIEARPGGFEPPTLGSVDRCSIQLSYGRKRGAVIARSPRSQWKK